MIRIFLLCVALSSSGLTFAQTEVPHTFETGQPARAAEVNENFTALETAVDDNATALATNEAAIQQNSAAIAELASGDAIVLDLSDPDACVIDQPGYYILDRSWDWRISGEVGCAAESMEFETILIHISADDVIFDLNGFGLFDDMFGENFTLLDVTGSRVTVRNGTIEGGDVFDRQGIPLSISGADVLIENISTTALWAGGRNIVISNSAVGFLVSLVGQGSILENSRIGPCFLLCVLARNDTIVRLNRIDGGGDGGIAVRGDNVLIESNVVNLGGGPAISVDGNINTIVRNTLPAEPDNRRIAIEVNGTENIIDANIITPTHAVGIMFRVDGNYYGNNRVSAVTPFDLGGTTQTDWGGNVSY